MRKRVRTCSERSSIAPRLETGSDWREVLDRFDQRFLTIYVARIGGALALFARSGGTGIVKTLAILARFSSVMRLACSISSPRKIFSLILLGRILAALVRIVGFCMGFL